MALVTIYTQASKGSALTKAEADASLVNIKAKLDAFEPLLEMVQVGSIIGSMNSNHVSGWLECNGQEVSRTTYSALYSWANTNSLIAATADGDDATPFGDGDGSTTFKLPDLREKILRGKGSAEDLGENVASSKLKAIDHTHAHTLTLPEHNHDVIETKATDFSDEAGAKTAVNDVPATENNVAGTAIDGDINSLDQDVNVEQPSINIIWKIKY